MLSKVGIEVVDAHAHFFTASTLKAWSLRGRTREGFEQRTRSRTDMTSIELPDESTDVAQQWVDEMNRYGITAMGFMVGAEAYDEFLEAKARFPGRFMGYANINPGDPEAAEKVGKAARDGLQGIKLYPSSWPELHTYDAACYPVYEAALRQFRRGSYGTARAALDEFLTRYPNHELAPDAQYFRAETFAEEGDAETALDEYARVLELYPHSRRAPTALYKSGLLELRRGNADDARTFFNRVVQGYPDSDEFELAQRELDRLSS